MKTRHVFFSIILLALLSACELPGKGALPFISNPTVTPTPTQQPVGTLTLTPTVTQTRTPTSTPTATPTITPLPTRKSPYPVGVGTLLPDPGFPAMDVANVGKLKPIFRITDQNIWQSAASRDGKELFVATSNGLLVYDRQGKQLAYWPKIILYNLPCESCLSANRDGSRFALMTRKDGKWEAQVYSVDNVDGEQASLLFKQPLETAFQGIANEVRVALSPDGLLLAYGAGDGDSVVVELASGQQVFSYKGAAEALIFTPDGSSLALRSGRGMRFWKTATWKNPLDLLLPADDTPYAFSPDGKFLAIATATRVRIFVLDKLAPTREIIVPPPDAVKRTWQIAFEDETTLRGFGLQWDASHTKATVDVAEWNVETGKQLKLDTSESDSPDALSALSGATIPATTAAGEIALGQYDRLGFIGQDTLQIASLHSACWLKLSTGEKSCFDDPKNRVLASDTGPYREVLQDHDTLLQNWNGGNVFDISPYRIIAVSKTADYILVNANDATTDLYFKGKKLPAESLPGTLHAFAENSTQMAIASQKSGLVYVALRDKTGLKTLYRKQDRLFLKPLALDTKGNVYLLQHDPDRPEAMLKAISPAAPYQMTDVARLPMPVEPQVMALASATGLFALGLQDGSVLLVSADGQQSASFQAAYSPVSAIAFTPDGRYLAVGSTEGVQIFAVLP